MDKQIGSNLLREIFYDPKQGLSSPENLYRLAKKRDPDITFSQVKDFIRRQATNQVHKEKSPPKHYFPIKAGKPDHIWNIDLMDISRDAHHNSGYNFVLTVIDIYSRFAAGIPLKNKEGPTVLDAMKVMLNGDRKPEIIMSDNDSAFTSKAWMKEMEKQNIEMKFNESGDHHKSGIIDSFIRNLRRKIEKFKTAANTNRFIDVLGDLIENYNNSPHSSLGGSTPADPNYTKAKAILKDKEDQAEANYHPEKFPVGSRVRYVINKGKFEKGSRPKWSVVHTVTEQDGRDFKLSNGKTYKYYQLQPIVESQDGPEEPKIVKRKEKQIKPKKLRLALQKEGVEEENQLRTLRSRKPANQLLTDEGERIIWT